MSRIDERSVLRRSDLGDQSDQRALVVVCLTGQCAHSEQNLTVHLETAGYEVAASSSLEHVSDRVAAADFVVVLSDDSSSKWLESITDLLCDHPNVRPVVIAELHSSEEFFAALAAGVVGFCRPDTSAAAIVRAVVSVEQNGTAIPRGMVTPLVEEIRHGRGHTVHTIVAEIEITDREEQILQLLLQRRSTRQMAEALSVSSGTVRSHMSTLLRKLGAHDRDDAIAIVERSRGF